MTTFGTMPPSSNSSSMSGEEEDFYGQDDFDEKKTHAERMIDFVEACKARATSFRFEKPKADSEEVGEVANEKLKEWYCNVDRLHKAKSLLEESDPSGALVHLQTMSSRSKLIRMKSLEIQAKCYTLLDCLSGAVKASFRAVLFDIENAQKWINCAEVLMGGKQFRHAQPFLLQALKLAEQSKDIVTVFQCRKLLHEIRKQELIKEGGDEGIAEIAARLFKNPDHVIKEGLNGMNFNIKYCTDANVTGFTFGDYVRKKKLRHMIRDYNAYVTKRKSNNPDKRLMNYY